ncbi:hypothetical protein ABIF23_006536 [Bradyrhizobium elkanii]|uniref:hypothetical protein n=1 Tax=Bradyrhizobium elkanii TaxID=29448 RepID=UPI003518701E
MPRTERCAGGDLDPEEADAGHDAAFREQVAVSPGITADLVAACHPRFEIIARRPRSDLCRPIQSQIST